MGDSNHAVEGWEWDNIFLLEQDTGVIPWYGDLFVPQPTTQASVDTLQGHGSSHGSSESSLQSSQIHPSSSSSFPEEQSQGTMNTNRDPMAKLKNGEASSSTPVLSAMNASEGSFESSDYNHRNEPLQNITDKPPDDNALQKTVKKKKKRDPRLDCPNFLAGRIPCACPEEDALSMDIEDEVVKKKSKLGVHCQVPSCGDDISHLKGYHQRHRVCLDCANSPKVILKDGPHRYCQQCGKFHRLSDFDEGKRSCRRKLERHNKRRRRRPVGVGETQEDGDPDSNNSNDNNQNANEEWNKAIATKQTHQRKQRVEKRTTHGKHENKVKEPKTDSPNQSTDDWHTSCDSPIKVMQETVGSEKAVLDTQSLLSMLMEGATIQAELANQSIKHIHHTVNKAEIAAQDVNKLMSRSLGGSTSEIRHAKYVSPYPTGRVSFKLYDWNPADFPRRLRQQIFEWLANMPVELEGYIRSGCIILTFFMAMPPIVWDKIMDGWISHIKTLLLCPGTRVLCTSQISLHTKMKAMHIEDGRAMNVDNKERLTPYLLDIYPPSLEAGCDTHIYICGFNFSGAKVFVSFGEQYLNCSDCEPVSRDDFTHSPSWESIKNLEIQKITVFCPNDENFGLAFVEVSTDNGVSNFMPILITDKYVCDEVNSLISGVLTAHEGGDVSLRHNEHKLLKPQWCLDVVSDLGWTFRYPKEHTFSDRVENQKAFVERIERLFRFSVEHNLVIVFERLVQIALKFGVVKNDEAQYFWNTQYKTSTLGKDIFTSHTFSTLNFKAKQLCSLTTLKDESSSISSTNNIQGLTHEDVAKKPSLVLKSLEQPQRLRNSESIVDTGYTITMEEMTPLLDDTSEEKTNWTESLNWCRRPRRNTVNAANNHQRLWRVVVGAVCVVSICTGMCFMLQHPHEVAEMSMSLRRCLWGPNSHV